MYWFEHILLICSSLMTLVVIPLAAIFFKRMEKRDRARDEANKRFYGYVIWGIESVGGLSRAIAIARKNQKCNGETDEALQKYEDFERELNKFKTQQTAKTL